MSSLRARTVRNISYTGIAYLLALVLNFVAMAILARFLTPADFGIVASAMIVVNLLYAVQDFGITPAIVQRDRRIEDSIRVGISVRVVAAISMALVAVAVSPLVSDAFDQPEIMLVLIVLSMNLIVLTTAFSSQVSLTRSLRFRELSVATASQYLAFSAVSLALAWSGQSYWSLVIGYVSGTVTFAAVLRYYGNPRLKPLLDKDLRRELLAFGKHLLVTSLMAYAVFNVDQLAIAWVIGAEALGIYYVAVRFGRIIGEQISAVVNRVLFPTMARIKEDLVRLKSGYVLSLRMITMCIVPLSLGLSALSEVFVDSVLGVTWVKAVFPLTVLSIQGLLNALVTPAGNVLVSIGKPRYMSIQTSVQALLLIALIYPAALYYGIDGVCILTTLLSLGVLVFFVILLPSVLSSTMRELYGPLLRPLASGGAMFVILVVLADLVEHTLPMLVLLAVLGLCIYIGLIYITSRGRDIRDFIDLFVVMRSGQ